MNAQESAKAEAKKKTNEEIVASWEEVKSTDDRTKKNWSVGKMRMAQAMMIEGMNRGIVK